MMQILVVKFVLVLICATFSVGENCDKLGILLYEDLGCTPVHAESQSCPTKFTCPHLDPWKDKCYFRGKTYNNREAVNESLLVPPCDKGCFCSSRGDRSQFTCAILDCVEWLGGAPVGPGCHRTYSLDGCCSNGQICPPLDNVAKCLVDDKEYKEGERFTPKDTCLHCVCQKGFQGKFEEPFCKRQTCGIQLRRSGENVQRRCAPLYGKEDESEARCCPYGGWICSDGSEEIKGEAKSDDVCFFGDKSLKLGQEFEKVNFRNDYGRTFNKLKCKCLLPPLLTCHEM